MRSTCEGCKTFDSTYQEKDRWQAGQTMRRDVNVGTPPDPLYRDSSNVIGGNCAGPGYLVNR